MTKEMIISSNDHETRVAILEDDLVAELFVERERQRGVVGNIYKGRVSKVLPGMQSAFVDIGLERDGFLYVSDVAQTVDELDRLEAAEEGDGDPAEASKAGETKAADVEWRCEPAEDGRRQAGRRRRAPGRARTRKRRRRGASPRRRTAASRRCSKKGRTCSSRS